MDISFPIECKCFTVLVCMFQSVIMVVFREDKHLDDERKAWEFWHSRQHSYKQRVLDIGINLP